MQDRTVTPLTLPKSTVTIFEPVTARAPKKLLLGAQIIGGGPPLEDISPKVLRQLPALSLWGRLCHKWRLFWLGCPNPPTVLHPDVVGQLGELQLDLGRPLPPPALSFSQLPLCRFIISGRDNLRILLFLAGLAASLLRWDRATFLAASEALHFARARLFANALIFLHINYKSLICKLTLLWKIN